MVFIPNRKLGLTLGFAFLLILLTATVIGVLQLAKATMSAWIILWVLLPVVGVPLILLVSYRTYGLMSASYRLDREGFYLTWGLAFEQIPLEEIRRVESAAAIFEDLKPRLGLWWPGCIVGHLDVEGMGTIEFFATRKVEGLVLLETDEQVLAISPPDVAEFQTYFVDTVRMGSLEPIAARSQRPDFIFARLWSDLRARILVLSGLLVSLFLFGFLAFRAGSLPLSVPFGFDPLGTPDPYTPPGRLLLLPMIAGLSWLVDFLIGAWLYRKEDDHPLAYATWAVAILVGGLLWGATLHLLAAA